MEETRDLQKLYTFLQGTIYLSITWEISIVILLDKGIYSPVIETIFSRFSHFIIYQNILFSKLTTFFLIIIVAVGTKSRKDLELNTVKNILMPLLIGVILFFGSLTILNIQFSSKIIKSLSITDMAYIGSSFLGAILIHIALDNVSKRIKNHLLADRFNIESESFQQSKRRIETPYSVNIPMKYYFRKRTHKGWLNVVNPFRATLSQPLCVLFLK